MDFVIEKLLELEEEQRQYWQVEMTNDAREQVEMGKIRELGRQMEEHLKAHDLWGLAAFVLLVLGKSHALRHRDLVGHRPVEKMAVWRYTAPCCMSREDGMG
jgi:hypothetical protein